MKKPLILLVDDDRAVLDALEAELRPAFEEIARIEAFDDPRAVLEALPGWAAEGRTVAVAVVDQRMPNLTGVDLLLRLRTSARPAAAGAEAGVAPRHPAAHIRTMLLTGYSDLDLSIAAKNEAGVDRYVEKPWDPRIMLALVRRLFAWHLTECGTDACLVYREVVSVRELREQFRLRYDVYSLTPDLVYLLPRTKKRIALDEYDTVSRFYGMYRVALEDESPVGGLRVINAANPDAGRAIVALANEDPALLERAQRPVPHPIELPLKWPEPQAVLRLLDDFDKRGERFVEISRLVVTPTQRGQSLSQGLVALALLESTAAFVGFVLAVENTLQTCSVRHQAAYARLGFRIAEGTRPSFITKAAEVLVCLHARVDQLPPTARARIQAVAERGRSRGFVCRCATFPACLGGPYETGAFRGTDLFCPLQAREVLQPALLPNDGQARSVPQPDFAA
jgi:CheY-like chemotaxis protein